MTIIDNKQPAQNVQTLAVQQSIEEAYLDSLLSSSHAIQGTGDSIESVSEKNNPVITVEPAQQTTLNKAANMQSDDKVAPDIKNELLTGAHPQLPFVCQLISVSGLKLALQLSTYTQIISWPEELLPVSNNQQHLIGQMKSGACVFDIVDLAELITGQATAMSVENNIYPYSHVLLLQDGITCIPCEAVLETVTVNPEKVCWRNPDSHRTWLAGTVKDDGFALLDTDNIMKSLENN